MILLLLVPKNGKLLKTMGEVVDGSDEEWGNKKSNLAILSLRQSRYSVGMSANIGIDEFRSWKNH